MKKFYYKLSWINDGGQWQEELLFSPREGLNGALRWLHGRNNVRKMIIEKCDKEGNPLL